MEAAMTFRVSGKNLDVGDALRKRIAGRIGEAVGKYFDGGFSGHATVAKDGSGFRTECALHLDSRITLRAEASAPDVYLSADQAALRLEKRLRRYHRRLKEYRPRAVRSRPADAAS
jgi:ribosomal subunit interface protein